MLSQDVMPTLNPQRCHVCVRVYTVYAWSVSPGWRGEPGGHLSRGPLPDRSVGCGLLPPVPYGGRVAAVHHREPEEGPSGLHVPLLDRGRARACGHELRYGAGLPWMLSLLLLTLLLLLLLLCCCCCCCCCCYCHGCCRGCCCCCFCCCSSATLA
jgi:hypothetical protein